MDDTRFWSLIESAWNSVGGHSRTRQQLADGELSDDEAEDLNEALVDVITALRDQLDHLLAAELLTFDRILERKLYDIDRAEIQEHTDGSDDGFLYARGFIVIVGKAFYDAVNTDPTRALMDLECEEMCYLSFHLHAEKFGDVPPSGISRESGSNKAGWPDID
jgi:hypothetical protein